VRRAGGKTSDIDGRDGRYALTVTMKTLLDVELAEAFTLWESLDDQRDFESLDRVWTRLAGKLAKIERLARELGVDIRADDDIRVHPWDSIVDSVLRWNEVGRDRYLQNAEARAKLASDVRDVGEDV
jgi:hypothetical protein